MTNPENHQPTEPLYHGDDDSIEATIANVESLYAFQRTSLDELLKLSRDESKQEQFEALLDDLTYEALSDNQEFLANIKLIKEHRGTQEEQEAVRDRQRALFESQKQAILEQSGISSEHVRSDMTLAKERIKGVVLEELKKDPTTEPHEILGALGMLSLDEKGQEVFSYPAGLFPESTDKKWLTYLESVRTHLRVDKAVSAGLREPIERQEADRSRRVAHNAVSKDVDELLGLESLPNSKWDFNDTRELLAKIRDSRFPTVETGEKFRTERRILEGVIGEAAIRALRTRLSDLHRD